MTYEEAIKYLPMPDMDDYGSYVEDAFYMAIEALEFRSKLNENAKLLLSSDYNSKEAKLFWSDLMEMME